MALWPRWTVTPLFVLDALGTIACLSLFIAGVLHVAKPDIGRPRFYGLKLIGVGLLCLTPLLTTILFADKLPLAF